MGTKRNYLFISDLHLSEGRDPATGKTSPNEDFFQDEAFAHFIVYHVKLGLVAEAPACYRRPWTLVVNGDLFDFLQVTSLPAEGEELQKATGKFSHKELSKNERRYGLGTTQRETVWKLGRIQQGHPLFFQALAWFLAHPNNDLVILKGNHDVELFWPGVQAAMRGALREVYTEWRIQAHRLCPPASPLPLHDKLLPNLDLDDLGKRVRFPAWFLYEPGLFFAEHGNQYDPFNDFDDFLKPILPSDHNLPADQQRVNAPAGSLVVRYFFNKLEQVHPFADNLKPLTRYLNYALNEDLGATLRIGLSTPTTLPLTIWNLLKKRWQDTLRRDKDRRPEGPPAPEHYTDPPGQEFGRQLREAQRAFGSRSWRFIALSIGNTLLGLILRIGMMVLLFLAIQPLVNQLYGELFRNLLLAGLVALVRAFLSARVSERLSEAINLRRAAEVVCQILNESQENGRPAHVRYHIYGHDHHTDLVEIGDQAAGQPRQWYVNTGCWLPTLSEYDRLTRGDVQLTFFRIIPDLDDADDGLPALMQWPPEGNEPRPLRLLDGER